MNNSYWRKVGVVAARSCRGRGELRDGVWDFSFFNVNIVSA